MRIVITHEELTTIKVEVDQIATVKDNVIIHTMSAITRDKIVKYCVDNEINFYSYYSTLVIFDCPCAIYEITEKQIY